MSPLAGECDGVGLYRKAVKVCFCKSEGMEGREDGKGVKKLHIWDRRRDTRKNSKGGMEGS